MDGNRLCHPTTVLGGCQEQISALGQNYFSLQSGHGLFYNSVPCYLVPALVNKYDSLRSVICDLRFAICLNTKFHSKDQ
jgi:hypothetical protein